VTSSTDTIFSSISQNLSPGGWQQQDDEEAIDQFGNPFCLTANDDTRTSFQEAVSHPDWLPLGFMPKSTTQR
jgi:hypothetical protein